MATLSKIVSGFPHFIVSLGQWLGHSLVHAVGILFAATLAATGSVPLAYAVAVVVSLIIIGVYLWLKL